MSAPEKTGSLWMSPLPMTAAGAGEQSTSPASSATTTVRREEGLITSSRKGPSGRTHSSPFAAQLMTLQQLTYFLAAIEHGSFSAAAESLHLAQPSLSEQIRRLEAELGLAAVRPRRPRARADRGGPPAAPARRAHGRRRARRPPPRCARCPTDRRHGDASAPSATRPTTCSPTSSRTSARATRRCSIRADRPELVDGGRPVRDGRLEAGLIVLPIDDRGLEVRPAVQDEIVLMSRDPERLREPMTIERIMRAPADPLRRALRLERPDPPPVAGPRAEGGRRSSSRTSRSSTSRRRSSSPRAGSATRSPRRRSRRRPRRSRTGSGRSGSTRRCTTRSPSSHGATRTYLRRRARSWRWPRSGSSAS